VPTMRRTSGTTSAVGLGGVCFVLALLILSPMASAARPTLTFVAPYTGGTVSVTNSTVLSSCDSRAAILSAPAFNTTTGKVKFGLESTAGHGPKCGLGQGHTGTASTTVNVIFISASFLGPANGIYIFRPSFHLTWLVNISTHTGPGAPGSGASAIIELRGTLTDLTTGSSWSTSSPYINDTRLNNANSTVSQTLHANLSLPVLVPLSKGDSYYFLVVFYGEADASVGMGSANTASAKLVVGIGAGMSLAKVTIS
jgi:hypothetical protein